MEENNSHPPKTISKRKITALITKLNLMIEELFTFLPNKRTLLITQTTTNTIRKLNSLRFGIIY